MVSPRIRYDLFFDRPAVMSVIARAERRGLSKIGAFVRKKAQNMPKRKRSSRPGQPPSRHGSTRNSLRFILFQYEPQNHSVVIGPVKFSNTKDTPHVMEHGGSVVRRGKRGRPSKIIRYQPRPFMGPALIAVAAESPSIFAGEVRV